MYNEFPIRTMIINNTNYFSANDIANALHYNDTNIAIGHLCDLSDIKTIDSDKSIAIGHTDTVKLIKGIKLPNSTEFHCWFIEINNRMNAYKDISNFNKETETINKFKYICRGHENDHKALINDILVEFANDALTDILLKTVLHTA